jgi:hypothetical protein
VASLLMATDAAAQDLPDPLEIVGNINARDEGLTSTRNIKMELIARDGNVRTRETVFFRRYVPGTEAGDAGEKWIVLFYLTPTTIKDTAFLSHDYLESKRDDEQWLYLPALRRSRRIALRDRGKSFLGTDLSYDDVRNETKVTASDYHWTTLRREEVDGKPAVVLQAIPVDKQTARFLGYSRVEFTVDTEIWMVRSADYWDPADRHLKTSRQLDIRAIDGIWTPHRVEVLNHRTFHRTRFTYSEVRYGAELPEDLFTERALRRGPPAL